MNEEGVNVFGIGDEIYENLHHELQGSLTEYYKVSEMEDYDEIYQAIGYFIHKYGRIHFIESFNEHWVETEARLREDFNVTGGYRNAEMSQYKRKSGMKKVYQAAGLKTAPGCLAKTIDEALNFTKDIGYPIIMKPDIGVGASGATKINDEAELRKKWNAKAGFFLEQFVNGNIETYDGLCDSAGNTVFYCSMQYTGLMEVLSGENESMHYYIVKDVPKDLIEMGDITVRAFNVKSRFFHCEFFRTTEGELLPLEINLRPPGVITVDIWNYSHRIDIYQEYANVITKQPVTPFKKPQHFGTFVARRNEWHYVHSHEEVKQKLGSRLELEFEMPPIYSGVMGNFAYVFISDTFPEMREAVEYIEERYR